jgi:hypothetical protein
MVGSAAGVAGVGVAVAAIVIQARSGRTIRSRVTAELGSGQLADDGVLSVEFVSGKTDVIRVPEADGVRARPARKTPKKDQRTPQSQPVNVIAVCNQGVSPVTISHCHYAADLEGTGFRFEPQPEASPRGDHLPKRLEPGESALLIHEVTAMRVFLNRVLLDHGVTAAVFEAVLTFGHGIEVSARPALQVHADMSEGEIAAAGFRLTREEIDLHSQFARPSRSRSRRVRRPR